MSYFNQDLINQYTFGDCNIFAIALSRLTGLDMVAISRRVINEEEEEYDDEYVELECSHAAVLVDDDTILDVKGLTSVEKAFENTMWNHSPEFYHDDGKIFLENFGTDGCEDMSSNFASYEEELIEEATIHIKNSNILDLLQY